MSADNNSHNSHSHSDSNGKSLGSDLGSDNATASEEVSTETLQKNLDTLKTEQLYLRAEFDNYRKQMIKERSDLLKFGAERLIVALLDVIDNFERALHSEVKEDNVESFRKGVELTAAELKDVLERFGVRSLPAEGQPFDPSLHEALSSEETDRLPPGHITQVFRQAYKLHDRLIRPAQVVVAKEVSQNANKSPNNEQ